MSKDKMMQMAERNLSKAKKAFDNNYNRQGVTESERENLLNNVEYAQTVYNLLEDLMLEQREQM